MSGVGEYKTRKGNMSGPSLVGFLAPDTHNECPKKAARGKRICLRISPSPRRQLAAPTAFQASLSTQMQLYLSR
ncbi:hypothetical protein EMIT048CA2_50253 [Pseudomonas chlororaphis]